MFDEDEIKAPRNDSNILKSYSIQLLLGLAAIKGSTEVLFCYLTPAFSVSYLRFILEMSYQFVTTWQHPYESSSIGCVYLNWRRNSHPILMNRAKTNKPTRKLSYIFTDHHITSALLYNVPHKVRTLEIVLSTRFKSCLSPDVRARSIHV